MREFQTQKTYANLVYLLLLLSGVTLGWRFYIQHKDTFHYIQATKRSNPTGRATALLWQYEGEPLRSGQMLHIKARYLHFGGRGKMRVLIYEDSNHDGIPDREIATSQWTTGKDHLDWFEYRIRVNKAWQRPLFIGIERPPGLKTFWIEKFNWHFTPLSSYFFYRENSNDKFKKGNYPLASELLLSELSSEKESDAKANTLLLIIGGVAGICALWLSIRKKVVIFPYLALLVVVLVWRWVSALAPTTNRWSGFFFPRMEQFWLWSVFIAGSLCCLPSVAFWVYDMIGLISRWWRRRKIPLRTIGYALLIFAGAYVFWVWRSNAIYGDGYGPLMLGYTYHNPFALALYDGFKLSVKALFPGFFFAWYRTIPVYSALWGVLFIVVLLLLSRTWGRNSREHWLVFLSLITLPAVAEFFGYVEVYASVICLSVFVLFLFGEYCRKKTSVVGLSAGAFFNYLHHLSSALFLPVVIVAWVKEFFHSRTRIIKRVWLTGRAVLFTLFLAGFIWAQCMFLLFTLHYKFDLDRLKRDVPRYGLEFLYGSTNRPLSKVFLLSNRPHGPHIYGLATASHLKQTVAEWMFLNPMAIFLFVVLNLLYVRRIASDARWLALTLTGLFFIAGAFLLSPSYPYPKDWDLFSLHSVVLQFISFLFILRFVKTRWRRYILITLIVYQFLWTLPFLYYNHFCGVPIKERFFGFY
ncbi:hypothetical protein J7M23_04485 [Candidatus Sumerlaeota bacterium]|nr:hypothetical protein [Candidatus Sumerlaeota bacterium]